MHRTAVLYAHILITLSHAFSLLQISNLPKYTQLRMNITATYPGSAAVQALGSSDLFALTDVATASFLSDLYSIPRGMSVQHGSNQSVAEFYGEVSREFRMNSMLCVAARSHVRLVLCLYSSTATTT